MARPTVTKHLVLFDFSLSQAGTSIVEAGAPLYLDPFLGQDIAALQILSRIESVRLAVRKTEPRGSNAGC